MKILKFNENVDVSIKGYTVGQLRELIKDLDDDTPVVKINPVGVGDNNHDAFEIGMVEIGKNGYASVDLNDSPVYTTKGLLIYEQ